jgi:hypothetical protein
VAILAVVVVATLYLYYWIVVSGFGNISKISNQGSVSSGTEFLVPPDEIVSGGPPKDGIPSIDNPKFVSVSEARSFVSDDTQGILVKVGEDVRFYPYNILLWHEIVNDRIDGKPLAITFCPLCATGIVFEREINNTVYEFGTSGKLYKSNLVMYDRQTDSYWSQALGMAIAGKLAGTKLTIYPSSILDFKNAVTNNPGMKVLSTNTGFVRDYTFNPYSSYENSDEILFGVKFNDNRLPAKELVYGILVDGKPMAYNYLKLLASRNLNNVFSGHNLTIKVDEDNEIEVFDNSTGKRIVGIISFWFSWVLHNPETGLWNGE